MRACFRTRPDGYTLIELIVAMLTGAVVISGALMMLSGTLRHDNALEGKRHSQQGGRRTLFAIEDSRRFAGFGIDPALAVDTNVYRCATPGDPTTNCTMEDGTLVAGRDRSDGSDELVFYARNPYYFGLNLTTAPAGRAWTVNGAAGGAVSLNARAGDTFCAGQILLFVAQPEGKYAKTAYVTAQATASAAADGVLAISLTGTVAGDPFQQAGLLADPELTNPAARVFAVDRYRYFIDTYAQAYGTGQGGNAARTPFLMLDRGLDCDGDNDVTDEYIPIAENVENLQVVYGVRGDVVIGDAAGRRSSRPTSRPPTVFLHGLRPYRNVSYYSNAECPRDVNNKCIAGTAQDDLQP